MGMNEETAEPAPKRKAEPPRRRAAGFLPAASLAPVVLRSVGAKRGFAELRLVTEWEAVAGARLAALCRPVKVSYRGGAGLGATLVLAAPGARAPEVEMLAPALIERVNAFYGYRAVARIRIDQSAAAAKEAAPRRVAPPEPALAPVDGIEDERLALALARLGANVRAKAAGRMDGRTTE